MIEGNDCGGYLEFEKCFFSQFAMFPTNQLPNATYIHKQMDGVFYCIWIVYWNSSNVLKANVNLLVTGSELLRKSNFDNTQ